MTGTSDEIIILSDDDEDEIKIEPISSTSRPIRPNPSPKRRTPILILTEPKSLTYGIERGYKLKHIHGMKHLKNELMYLIEYDACNDYEFVPAKILRQYCDENLLIEYLEKLTQFTD